MAMTVDELKNVFHTALFSEFESIPSRESEIDYTFSLIFRQRMEKIIYSRRKTPGSSLCVGLKRAALIAFILLLAIAPACKKGIPRKTMAGYEVEDHGNHYELIATEKGEKRTVEKIYSPGFLPDGFRLYEQKNSGRKIWSEYRNENGGTIIIVQNTVMVSMSMDADFTTLHTETVSDCEVLISEDERDAKGALFRKDGYYFKIDWDGGSPSHQGEGTVYEYRTDLETLRRIIEELE